MNYPDWSERQRHTSVTVDGHDVEFAYYEAGADRDGPPVVLLHGIPTWSYLWRDAAPALGEHRHVFAPNLPGYGNSERGEGFDRSVRAATAALADFLASATAHRTVDLVGHDIGGAVALRYAAARPDAVGRLVLSNAACFDSWPVEVINDLGAPGVTAGWTDEELDDRLEYLFVDGAYDEADPSWVAGMKSPWTVRGGRTDLARAAVATNTNHTTEIAYGDITADLLCLWGAEDGLQPVENAQRLVSETAGDGRVVRLDEAAHWVTHDRPDAYRDSLLDFLA
ncbi:alpha/beta fold hydrolase [Candidatus Halobonum tyrrellensis]|uniref:Alpha/beta hydrolase fold protein n=1 Tax=Candidatus Halobonum tyrrellensis G22 TaxID=1324957 RepID=V4GV22_9EURY|nr:alpha/beta hydrolase [Candidatus Halobonum tyrrellensis]ESP88986.1 alpha/beta hydrolase fold protein [Candidatus Halobonum tyrrellensis G22]